MHICDMSIGMLGATGIVGTGIPGAVGSALASRNKGNGRVTVVFFGDGAANCGQLAESMNMAAAWNLPVVFICENNQWAVATEIGRVVKEKDIYKRAYGYGIPGKLVDGFNVYDVYKHSKEAIDLARNDGGPTLLECKFMRIIGHHSLDDNKYRDMDHINKYWELDPIKRMREFMIKNNIATKKEFDAIDENSRVKVAASVDYADNKCTEPPLKTLWDDVYANGEIIE
jgi:pyruvate dehydrogenase E1 component alpha subunit